jgi:hypothetical protein
VEGPASCRLVLTTLYLLNSVKLLPSELVRVADTQRPRSSQLVLATCWAQGAKIASATPPGEAPLTTAAQLLIPRILQQRWYGVSKIVTEIGTYQRTDVPIVGHVNLIIPVVIMLIPFHVCCLPPAYMMGSPASSPAQRMHEAAKTHLHGMLETFDAY